MGFFSGSVAEEYVGINYVFPSLSILVFIMITLGYSYFILAATNNCGCFKNLDQVPVSAGKKKRVAAGKDKTEEDEENEKSNSKDLKKAKDRRGKPSDDAESAEKDKNNSKDAKKDKNSNDDDDRQFAEKARSKKKDDKDDKGSTEDPKKDNSQEKSVQQMTAARDYENFGNLADDTIGDETLPPNPFPKHKPASSVPTCELLPMGQVLVPDSTAKRKESPTTPKELKEAPFGKSGKKIKVPGESSKKKKKKKKIEVPPMTPPETPPGDTKVEPLVVVKTPKAVTPRETEAPKVAVPEPPKKEDPPVPEPPQPPPPPPVPQSQPAAPPTPEPPPPVAPQPIAAAPPPLPVPPPPPPPQPKDEPVIEKVEKEQEKEKSVSKEEPQKDPAPEKEAAPSISVATEPKNEVKSNKSKKKNRVKPREKSSKRKSKKKDNEADKQVRKALSRKSKKSSTLDKDRAESGANAKNHSKKSLQNPDVTVGDTAAVTTHDTKFNAQVFGDSEAPKDAAGETTQLQEPVEETPADPKQKPKKSKEPEVKEPTCCQMFLDDELRTEKPELCRALSIITAVYVSISLLYIMSLVVTFHLLYTYYYPLASIIQ